MISSNVVALASKDGGNGGGVERTVASQGSKPRSCSKSKLFKKATRFS